jgi:sugar phosphate isomerase/epimerase
MAGTEATVDAKCFAAAFGKPGACLAELADQGVGSIELREFDPDSSANTLLCAAQSVIRSGMCVTLHGYLPNNTEDTLFGDVYPPLLPTIDFLKDYQEDTIMVVHAHADPHADHATLAESTARALQRIAESIHTGKIPVRVALEINRYHGADTPGTTYDGLLEMAQHAGYSEVGFCWDMGHTHSSVLQHKLPPAPPPEFVKEVIHTHIHGLSSDGTDTHRPLIESNSHIASGVDQLKSCGYSGIYNLELYPMRWGTQNRTRDGVLGSICCLRDILKRTAVPAAVDPHSLR